MVATLYSFTRLLCLRLQVGLDDLQVQQGEVIKGHLQFITICLYIALLDKVSQNFFIIFFLLTRASWVGPSTQCPSICGGDQD